MIERALSIRNPWAALIMSGNKLVENRTWQPAKDWRGTFVVHAGQKVDPDGLAKAAELGLTFGGSEPDSLPTSYGYIGLVDLVDVHFAVDDCCGWWAQPGCYHWQLANPRPFPEAIPGNGRLQLFRLPKDVLAAIDAFLYVDLAEILACGLTRRQVDHWATRGWLRPVEANPGYGHPRRWPTVERDVARVMARLVSAGLAVDVAAAAARAAVVHGQEHVALGGGVTISLREVVG